MIIGSPLTLPLICFLWIGIEPDQDERVRAWYILYIPESLGLWTEPPGGYGVKVGKQHR